MSVCHFNLSLSPLLFALTWLCGAVLALSVQTARGDAGKLSLTEEPPAGSSICGLLSPFNLFKVSFHCLTRPFP